VKNKAKRPSTDFAALLSAAVCLTIIGIGIGILLKPGLDSQDLAIHTVTFWIAEAIFAAVAVLLWLFFNRRRKKKSKLRQHGGPGT
jgi:hypothetical protein